jgi:hypothetical protein
MTKRMSMLCACLVLGMAGCSNFAEAQMLTLSGHSQTLRRVEALTSEEKAELAAAEAEVDKANLGLLATQAKIAAAHKMTHESYMEWSSWYDFDGDFILQRFQSNMVMNSVIKP